MRRGSCSASCRCEPTAKGACCDCWLGIWGVERRGELACKRYGILGPLLALAACQTCFERPSQQPEPPCYWERLLSGAYDRLVLDRSTSLSAPRLFGAGAGAGLRGEPGRQPCRDGSLRVRRATDGAAVDGSSNDSFFEKTFLKFEERFDRITRRPTRRSGLGSRRSTQRRKAYAA